MLAFDQCLLFTKIVQLRAKLTVVEGFAHLKALAQDRQQRRQLVYRPCHRGAISAMPSLLAVEFSKLGSMPSDLACDDLACQSGLRRRGIAWWNELSGRVGCIGQRRVEPG